MTLPTDYDARKAIPLAAVLDYFPDALRAVASVSVSMDPDEFLECFMRRGTGNHSAVMARLALAILQEEIQAPRVSYSSGLSATFSRFGDALAEIARVIGAGQAQHGTVGWDRAKSTDEESTLLRHFLERGTIDSDGVRHSAKMAWRALALLQKEIEAATGAPISRGSYDSSKGQTCPGDRGKEAA